MKTRALIQLALAGLLLLGVTSAYLAWYSSVGKMSAQADTLAAEIRAKTQDSARIDRAKEALESLAADEEAMRRYLVRQEDIVSFLNTIEDTGTGLGSAVEVVSVSADPAARRILLSVKITGSFDSVLRTVGAIEYGPYDSTIGNITLDTVPGEGGQTGTWTAAASFSIGTQDPAP